MSTITKIIHYTFLGLSLFGFGASLILIKDFGLKAFFSSVVCAMIFSGFLYFLIKKE